jgi:hypothetical protein
MNKENSYTGSFRDPSGSVFINKGNIYRSIFEPGAQDFEAARTAGIYSTLIEAGFLIHHNEIDKYDLFPEGTVYCLNHPRLPFVSYPWEWCFSMLKDAALIHVDMMEMLLPQGFWLRDASAFNIQYDGKQLRFIDTLSIGKKTPDSPWVAYGQFCSHFLAPLAMAAYCDIRTLALWRNYIDGIPLDLALKTLPFLKRCKPGIFMHLAMHAHAQKTADKKENIGKSTSAKTVKINDRGLLGVISSLRRTIGGISWKRFSKIWEDYEDIRSYSSEDVSEKSDFVNKSVRQVKPKMVWDLGANTGEFSIIAASHGAFVVSIDSDPACTENLYQRIQQEKGLDHILPLTMDLANPSPGLGWDSDERMSLKDRGPADLVLALALIHHLVFSCCIPVSLIAKWLSSLTCHLIIEFIPPADPMVKKLLVNRGDDYLPYSYEEFKASFETFFVIEDQMTLQNGRMLFLYNLK